MTLKIKCQECQKVINAPDSFAGKSAPCPGCKTILNIPPLPVNEEPATEEPKAVKKKGGKKIGGTKKGKTPGKMSESSDASKPKGRKRSAGAGASSRKGKRGSRKTSSKASSGTSILPLLIGLVAILLAGGGAGAWWFLNQGPGGMEEPLLVIDTSPQRTKFLVPEEPAKGTLNGKDFTVMAATYEKIWGLGLKSDGRFIADLSVIIKLPDNKADAEQLVGNKVEVNGGDDAFMDPITISTRVEDGEGGAHGDMDYVTEYEMVINFHSIEDGYLKGDIDLKFKEEGKGQVQGDFFAKLKKF